MQIAETKLQGALSASLGCWQDGGAELGGVECVWQAQARERTGPEARRAPLPAPRGTPGDGVKAGILKRCPLTSDPSSPPAGGHPGPGGLCVTPARSPVPEVPSSLATSAGTRHHSPLMAGTRLPLRHPILQPAALLPAARPVAALSPEGVPSK